MKRHAKGALLFGKVPIIIMKGARQMTKQTAEDPTVRARSPNTPKVSDLVGRKITAIRPMTPEETASWGWHGYPTAVIIELEGDLRFVPLRDEEGNGPGALLLADDNNGGDYACFERHNKVEIL
jgi:hypothetical protein